MGSMIVAGGFGALGRAVVAELNARGMGAVAVDMAAAPAGADGVGGVDLADEAAVAAAYARIAARGGPIDGLVNVAGGFTWETIADGTIASFDRMYRMNLRTAAVSVRAVLPHLAETGAAIVNVGAAAAAGAGTGMASYAASKAGVLALTESLAEELRLRRIRVNAVLPTIIDTPTNRADMPDADPGDWVTPQAAAKAIAFLLSADASAVTGVGLRLSLGV